MKIRVFTRQALLALACVSLALGIGGGCKRTGQQENRIRIVGSTSVFPFAEMLAEAYEKTKPGVRVDVQAGGSTVGIISVRDGICDIGTSSRELRDAEKNGVTIIEIARDGIAVIVHPSNKLDSLTKKQIRDIYAKKITNWKGLGGDDASIAFVTREEGSGTRGAFDEIVMGEDTRISPSGLVQDSNGSIREAVAISPHAIGYISLALVNEKVRAIKVDGVAPTHENLAEGEYPVVRPFLFLVKGQPKSQAKEFIDFVLGPKGQEVLNKEGLLSPTAK
jgi:phosphate transport system substrate-binding protein